MAAEIRQVLRSQPVRLAGTPEVLAKTWTLLLPGSDTDVDMVALGKDPAVAARDVGELDDGTPAVAVAGDAPVRDVSLERHSVNDPVAEPDCARGRTVCSVGADNHIGRSEVGRRTLPHLDARL